MREYVHDVLFADTVESPVARAAAGKNPQIKEEIELYDDEKIFGVVLLGYSRIIPNPPPKKDPIVKWI